MVKSIFSYSSYKSYLRDVLKSAPKAGRGLRNQMAIALKIQPTYLSQVLNGERDLSFDQCVLLTEYLSLGREEAEFLTLLLLKHRAGHSKSKQFVERQIESRKTELTEVKKRIDIQSELSDEDKAVYYSDSIYAAVHMAVTIESLQNIRDLCARLRITEARGREIVEFLASKNLISKIGDRLSPTNTLLFVDRASPFIVQHHRNWRLKAMEKIAERNKDDFHVSLGVTLSREDAFAVREQIAKLIEDASTRIKDSPAEQLMGLSIDFFEY